MDHREVTVHGAGRTDSGVHAKGQTASFVIERQFSPTNLRDAINGNLDPDIRVIEAEFVDPSFHARFSAIRKTYRYHIWTSQVASPFYYRYAYHIRSPLDASAMQTAAIVLEGRHDFAAFTVADTEAESTVRKIDAAQVKAGENMISITVSADGFLRYMVRTIVGTLIEVGNGRRTVDSMSITLDSKDRSKAGPTAPAHGLTLLQVHY